MREEKLDETFIIDDPDVGRRDVSPEPSHTEASDVPDSMPYGRALGAGSPRSCEEIGFGMATEPNPTHRERQEDAVSCVAGSFVTPIHGRIDILVGAVNDGMGGERNGDEASSAASGIPAAVMAELMAAVPEQVPDILKETVWRASRAIWSQSSRSGRSGATATIVAYLSGRWIGRHVWVASVGDSRAYARLDGAVTQVTRDHSLVQELVDAGELAHVEAELHPEANVITAALGVQSVPARFDVFHLPIGSRDLALVLCTDGVWSPIQQAARSGILPGPHITDYLSAILADTTAPAAAATLVADAVRCGGTDNATALVLLLGGTEQEKTNE
jgi:serine/threonine protein phosphatase PrpC